MANPSGFGKSYLVMLMASRRNELAEKYKGRITKGSSLLIFLFKDNVLFFFFTFRLRVYQAER